jgi:hypothetical protein
VLRTRVRHWVVLRTRVRHRVVLRTRVVHCVLRTTVVLRDARYLALGAASCVASGELALGRHMD